MRAATVATLRALKDRFYVPNNAVLTLAGDLDPVQGRRVVQGRQRDQIPDDRRDLVLPGLFLLAAAKLLALERRQGLLGRQPLVEEDDGPGHRLFQPGREGARLLGPRPGTSVHAEGIADDDLADVVPGDEVLQFGVGVEVRKSLREVDGAVLKGQARHFGKDG
mgnify:CR=1 FL=1